MNEVINLNLARKRRTREAAEVTAAQNRVRFGRTKAEKATAAKAADKAARDVEGHKRER